MRVERGALIRDANRVVVLDLIREGNARSRADLARLSGLSPSTVTAITASLMDAGLVVEVRGAGAPDGTTLGRPATPLRLDPTAGFAVGVKLSPDTLTATVTDLDATPLGMVSIPHRPGQDAATVVNLFDGAVTDVLTMAGVDLGKVVGIGIGLPGMVDPATGQISGSPLADPAEHDLERLLGEHFGLTVLVDNDVNTLTIAEHLFGAGRGTRDLVVITVGRGVGMGMVVNGQIARGWHGGAGEIGHLIVQPEGPACWCGRRGCLEAVAAEPALVREALAITGRLVAPGDLAALALVDARVADVLARAGDLVGNAIATVVQLVDPERVVVSGEGVRLGDIHLDALRQATRRVLGPDHPLDLIVEPWGDDAWARGAASLVLREFFHPAHLRDERRTRAVVVAPLRDPQQRQARNQGRGGSRS